MNKIAWKTYVLNIFLLLSLISCSGVINSATAQHQNWKFIESVGGLNIGAQDKNPNWLNIRGDVSGLTEYSTKPTLLNSGLAVKEVNKKIVDSRIQIYVVTTVISKKYSQTKIYGVNITGVKKGKYLIQYLNPDGSTVDLKEVEIY